MITIYKAKITDSCGHFLEGEVVIALKKVYKKEVADDTASSWCFTAFNLYTLQKFEILERHLTTFFKKICVK
jgi:hypothetical protein